MKKSSKKLKLDIQLEMDPNLRNPENLIEIRNNWQKSVTFEMDLSAKKKRLKIDRNPFRYCLIENFLSDSTVSQHLLNELQSYPYDFQKKDLFQFSFAVLKSSSEFPYMSSMLNFLSKKVIKWISEITDLELTSTSVSSSLYQQGDYLLPHDDLSDNRAVAFIYYMVPEEYPEWTEEIGGQLCLYETDSTCDPLAVTKSLFPRHNQLIFFEVGPTTYHRVSEMLAANIKRYTINGWFHFKESRQPFESNCTYSGLYDLQPTVFAALQPTILSYWINKNCFQDNILKLSRKCFVNSSQFSLHCFLKPKIYRKILNFLKSDKNEWQTAGPLSLRQYKTLNYTKLPKQHFLMQFLRLFYSPKMLNFLARLTSISFFRNYDFVSENVHFEFQLWSSGDYSSISDSKWFQKPAVDLIMFFGDIKSNCEMGKSVYIDLNESFTDPLLEIFPVSNALNVVYREELVGRLVPYLQNIHPIEPFYAFVITYTEK